MEKINVLVTTTVGEENLRRIAEVSPRLMIIDCSPLWKEPKPNDPLIDPISDEFRSLLAEAEVIFGFRRPPDILKLAPKLKWIQAMTAGVEWELTAEIVKSKVIVTTTRGIHSVQISELVFCMMLMSVKQAYHFFKQKEGRKWERYPLDLLHSKTLGIVGLGSIGRGIAHLGKAFGMRIVATRRATKNIGKARNVDVLYPREQLLKLLTESDFVVDCLPGTRETNKMIGERELRAMKKTAFIYNIGRGTTIDEDALIRALDQSWIAGAGLDVYQKEPLPPNSKLWSLPNVIITPHLGGPVKDYTTKATGVFCENLKRYVAGKKLRNVVNKKIGY